MLKIRKRIIWIIITIAFIAGGYYFLRPKAPVTVYTTAEAQKGDLTQTVSATGEVKQEEEIDLSFKTGGLIKRIYVEVGDRVKKGQQLARIDNLALSLQLQKAEAEVKVQKEVLSNMKKNSDTYSRDQRDAQKSQITKAEITVREIQKQIMETTIFSPIDGTIIKRNLDEGENISANVPILTVAGFGEMIVEADVPESDIMKIQVGQKAELIFDAFSSERKFQAEVSKIDPAATIIQEVVYYKVKFKINDNDENFKSGMSCDIDIRSAEKKNVLIIPLRAVKIDGSQKFVDTMLDEKNNITERKNITLGLDGDDGMVEVKGGDLNAGDKVVTFTKIQ